MTARDYDEEDARVQAFAEDFRRLVRKHMPCYPETLADGLVMTRMQDETSMYAPWIWADDAEAAEPYHEHAAVAAIAFALGYDCECPMDFLRCWNEGDFAVIRREWPEAPEAVFIGADPLHPMTVIAEQA